MARPVACSELVNLDMVTAEKRVLAVSRSGRHFASYLGITPRENSSGQIRRLGRISKRGDAYLRMLLIHGACSRLAACKRRWV